MQEQWLRADLASSSKLCTLAYRHHPRFSSGEIGSLAFVHPAWQALYDAGADVVISGHDHMYERLAPINADGTPDSLRGIREFVVGTGGRSLLGFGAPLPTTEVSSNETYGVLRITLHPTDYEWEFVAVEGGAFRDSGRDSCH